MDIIAMLKGVCVIHKGFLAKIKKSEANAC